MVWTSNIVCGEKLWDCNYLPAQLLDEVGSVLGYFLGELNHVNASQDDVVGFHRVRARKRRTEKHQGTVNKWTTEWPQGKLKQARPSPARQQLVHQDSKRPVVSWHVVALVEDDLWSNILRCSAECPRLLTDTNLLGKTEVHLREGVKWWKTLLCTNISVSLSTIN